MSIPLCRLLPIWRQRLIAEKAVGVKQGHLLLRHPEMPV
jgi:hypothetical protein